MLRVYLNILPLLIFRFKNLLSSVQAMSGDRVTYKGFLWTLGLKDLSKSRWVVISLRRHMLALASICGIRMFQKIERLLQEKLIWEDPYGLPK